MGRLTFALGLLCLGSSRILGLDWYRKVPTWLPPSLRDRVSRTIFFLHLGNVLDIPRAKFAQQTILNLGYPSRTTTTLNFAHNP